MLCCRNAAYFWLLPPWSKPVSGAVILTLIQMADCQGGKLTSESGVSPIPLCSDPDWSSWRCGIWSTSGLDTSTTAARLCKLYSVRIQYLYPAAYQWFLWIFRRVSINQRDAGEYVIVGMCKFYPLSSLGLNENCGYLAINNQITVRAPVPFLLYNLSGMSCSDHPQLSYSRAQSLAMLSVGLCCE